MRKNRVFACIAFWSFHDEVTRNFFPGKKCKSEYNKDELQFKKEKITNVFSVSQLCASQFAYKVTFLCEWRKQKNEQDFTLIEVRAMLRENVFHSMKDVSWISCWPNLWSLYISLFLFLTKPFRVEYVQWLLALPEPFFAAAPLKIK